MESEVDLIIAFENGELNDNEVLELFAELIKSGNCWHLQGFYGRTAQSFIDAGYIDRKGNILKDVE